MAAINVRVHPGASLQHQHGRGSVQGPDARKGSTRSGHQRFGASLKPSCNTTPRVRPVPTSARSDTSLTSSARVSSARLRAVMSRVAVGALTTPSGLEKLKNWSSQLYETDAIRVLINCSTMPGERQD